MSDALIEDVKGKNMFDKFSEKEMQAAISKNMDAAKSTLRDLDSFILDGDFEEGRKWAAFLVSQAKGLEQMFEVESMRNRTAVCFIAPVEHAVVPTRNLLED